MATRVIATSARSGFALGLSAGLILASTGFLLRDALSGNADGAAVAVAAAPASAGADAMKGPASGGSMESATLALRTRLEAQGGPDEQWELLARSYDFLGRPAEAQRARDHHVSTARGLSEALALSAALLPKGRTGVASGSGAGATEPGTATLLASAEQHRRKREFDAACRDYAALAERQAMNADTWADYADAQASLAGRLAGPPEDSIAHALALDPEHPKALWLQASLAHEQHRYSDALATWRRLLAIVPPGSSDARIVEANIAEATRLAKG